MKLQTRPITHEQFLYLLAFGIALWLRFLRLGETPLSDFEATHALQSWYAVQGKPFIIGPNPGYFSLTTLFFYLFPDTVAVARFWPALVGSLVVVVPYSYRRVLRLETALIIAYGLALDPGMVTLSRLAGGPMMAIGFGMLAMAFLYHRKPVWASIAGGLALVSGPGIFSGLVGLVVAFLLARAARLPRLRGILLPPEEYPNNGLQPGKRIPVVIVVGVVTALLASTLFMQYPGGIGGLGRAIESYLKGWAAFSGTPALQPLLAVIAYQPLAVVFAIIAAVRGWLQGEGIARWLSIWLVVVLLSSLLYPGRQVAEIAWGLIPLWVLAATEITRYLKVPQEKIPALALGGIVFVLSVLFWLMSMSPAPIDLTWIILVIVPLLILLTTVLVGLGWSWEAARSGSIWGLSTAAGLYIIAGMIGSSQLRFNRPEELWTPPPGTVQVRLLEDSLGELGLIQNGRNDWLDIVSTVDQPSLKWILKQYSNVRYISQLDLELPSPVIITSEDAVDSSDLSRTMGYLGQDFVWSAKPGWSGALPPEWWKWVLTRQAPIQSESIVLWARSDFFPDQPVSESDGSTTVPPEDEYELQQEEPIQ